MAAPSARPIGTPQEFSAAVQREYGLDFLRVFAFLVLVFYHSGMIFVSWDFHIKNAETSRTLENVMLFFNRWRLTLLFFISGAGVSFSLRRRSLTAFAGERFMRLFIPLAIGMFVIVPPQLYFERLFRHQFSGSYAEFYPKVFEWVSYPAGNTSWHHLWFVAYIFVYCIVSLPLFAFLRARPGRALVDALARAIDRWGPAIYLINIPNLLVAVTLGPRWPTTHNLVADWANLTGSLLTFLWGFILASDRRMLDAITRRRREFLIGAVALTVVFFSVRGWGVARTWPRDTRLLYDVLMSGYLGFTWICGLIGYARALITRPSAALSYATESVYPFYIIHQTVTITVGYYVIQTALPLPLKLAIVAAVTFFGSLLFVEIVRRITPLRPLFGLKLKTPQRA